MIQYNITYSVDRTVENDWLRFMKEEHVPVILKTGYFKSNKILKLLNEEYSEDGVTYAFQYIAENLTELEDFRETYEEAIEQKLNIKFTGSFVFFKTWLQEV